MSDTTAPTVDGNAAEEEQEPVVASLIAPPEAHTQRTSIRLSDGVRHKSPAAFLVFCYDSIDTDYMVFPERQEAEEYATEQAEEKWWDDHGPEHGLDARHCDDDLPPLEKWPVYALWAADMEEKPITTGGGGAAKP